MTISRKWSSIAVALILISPAFAQNDVIKQLEPGDQLFRQKKFQEALKQYERVNKSLGEKCSVCQVKIALAKTRLGDESGAAKAAAKAQVLAADSAERADANAARGEVLLTFANGDKKKLAGAEEAFREAIKEDASNPVFQLKLGIALLRQEKDEEGKAALKSYLAVAPSDATAVWVRKWIEDPRRARLNFAPEVSFVSDQGEKVSLADLKGKVVVVDFWATWCPPCRATVPEFKELVKRYPADKLILISISADEDEGAWKQYVASKGMNWIQYRDADKHVLDAFNIHAFPTYFVIDQEGIIRERIVGSNPQETVAGRLKDPLKKLLN